MKNDNKEVVFNAGPFQSYWWADEHEPIHPSIKAELTDEVDSDSLEKAWADTKKVYPVIECIPDDYDEEVIYYKSEGVSRPVQSKSTLQLVKDVTLYRGFSLVYFGNTVTLSAYHSLADEKGLVEIFKTLMNFYVSYYTNTPADNPYVMMKENRRPGEYCIQSTMLDPKDYRSQSVKLYKDIREIFNDTSVLNDENCAVTVREIDVSFSDFDDVCKETGSSPEEFFTGIMAKTIYNMYPDERKTLSFGIMTDFRETFGVHETISPCSKKMPLILPYEHISSSDIKTLAKEITGIRVYQKSDDYIKSHVALENTYSVLNIRNACLSVNYFGEFYIGEKTSYIKSITISDYSIRSVFMVRLGDIIKISFQYGSATDKYMNAVLKTINGLGIQAKVTAEAYPVRAEAEKPIV